LRFRAAIEVPAQSKPPADHSMVKGRLTQSCLCARAAPKGFWRL
jgi:hypothetical protein